MRGACFGNAGGRDVFAHRQHVAVLGGEVDSPKGDDLREVVALALVGIRGGGNEESAVYTVASEKEG